MSCANDNAKRQTYLWAKRMAGLKSEIDGGAAYVVYRENPSFFGSEVYNCCREEDFTETRGSKVEVVSKH